MPTQSRRPRRRCSLKITRTRCGTMAALNHRCGHPRRRSLRTDRACSYRRFGVTLGLTSNGGHRPKRSGWRLPTSSRIQRWRFSRPNQPRHWRTRRFHDTESRQPAIERAARREWPLSAEPRASLTVDRVPRRYCEAERPMTGGRGRACIEAFPGRLPRRSGGHCCQDHAPRGTSSTGCAKQAPE